MVTLTGTFTRLDGSPASGTVRVTPSRSPIMDPDGKIVISGPQTFPLDKDGTLSVPIPASNDPDLGPPFTYAIDVNLTHANWKISKVWIPHGSSTVDLSEIGDYTPVPGVATRVVTIPSDGTDGQVLVWDGVGFSWDFPPEGPQGPPGEVTTAALTAALAGKVTGTGMTLRHDTTVGTRVFLDHPGGSTMLHGDTGWRNITPNPLPTQITAGTILLRRVNNETLVDFRNLKFAKNTDGTSLALPFWWNVPIGGTGFGTHASYASFVELGSNPSAESVVGITASIAATTLYMRVMRHQKGTAWLTTLNTNTNDSFSGTLRHPTGTAWPTTLPGIPG